MAWGPPMLRIKVQNGAHPCLAVAVLRALVHEAHVEFEIESELLSLHLQARLLLLAERKRENE